MAIIKKPTNNKYWRESGEKGTLLNCWWKFKLVHPLWRTAWRFLKKLKIVTIWFCNHTPGHISGVNSDLKRYMHPNVHSSTIYNSQDMELLGRKLGMSNEGWLKGKGCKLISKPHLRHSQESSQICYKNSHRDFSNSCPCALGPQWIQTHHRASPTLAHSLLYTAVSSSILRQPGAH